ncbi:Retrovirus-related Pol polyprotein from transposon TNT 1-94 [Vitis vinifera]|uniref:Retrovirus-related Pol polyprotein from transposon TNT 1-94 n=1 Tax=Vitis vinifera TaxID=29760 RepID=A0A438H720_VITVI|nr:Retrovirus-related Pol polyprotein from transposon TNT 1-94 [Vitis vinifera]
MSMSLEIMKRYLRLPTAQEIWSALSKVFYDGSDELQIFTLNQKVFTAKQNDRSLSEYYGELTEIFCELDHRDEVVMKDLEDIAAYWKSIERQRVHIFLVGLDGDFEQIRGKILRKDPLPDLEECYALIQREVVRHASMKAESDNPDTSTMVVRQRSTQNWQDQSKTNHPKTNPNIDKSTFKCTHYNKIGHTKSRCFEIANVVEKASALVAATDYGDRSHPLDLPHKKLFPQPMVLCSDNGGDYQSSDLQKYLEGHGIIHQTTCSNTPQQNGVAERKNRHLLEVVRASLIEAKIPISYWGEAITSATYLINRVPSSSINFQTPLQALTNATVAPTIPNLPPHVFGCMEFVHLHKHQRTKLTSRALQLNQEADELDMSGTTLEPSSNDHPEIEEVIEEGRDSIIEPSPLSKQFGSEDVFTKIPNQSSSVKGVLNLEPDPFMKQLPHRHNRECPPRKKPIGCHWIYTVKYKADGSIERFKETGMSGCQPIDTPIEEGLKLCVKPNQVSTDKGRYQRLVERLMYLAHTRPDLAYALSVVSQYMHNPGEQHMNAVMRILRYLKNALKKGILFTKNVDHQSGNLVTWKSKKQNVVTRSSAEAQPIRLFCDNKATCDIAHNPVQHDRTKHVEVDRFFIKEKLDDKIVDCLRFDQKINWPISSPKLQSQVECSQNF